MTHESKTQADDTDIALLMQAQDESGLRLLLQKHGPRVSSWLKKKHGDHVADEALILAAHKAWNAADTYDETKGRLGPWFLAIAQNAALDILRREKRHEHGRLEYDPQYDPYDDDPETVEEPVRLERKRVAARNEREFRNILEGLPPLQRRIAMADLTEGTTVDAETLAERFGSSVNSIHVQRSKARATIRKEVTKHGLFGYGQGAQ